MEQESERERVVPLQIEHPRCITTRITEDSVQLVNNLIIDYTVVSNLPQK